MNNKKKSPNIPDKVLVAVQQATEEFKYKLLELLDNLNIELESLDITLQLISKYQIGLSDCNKHIQKALQKSGQSTVEISTNIAEKLLAANMTINDLMRVLRVGTDFPLSELLSLSNFSNILKDKR